MLIKLVPFETLCRHQFKIMGWDRRLGIGRDCEETGAGEQAARLKPS